ncbi:MAG: hypothetical protein AB1422_03070 [bacterium]
MNIIPLQIIDQKLLDFKLAPQIKVGEVLEGTVDEVLENKTYLFKLAGFTFRARSPLILNKYDRIQVEVKSIEPRIVFKLLPSQNKSNLPVSEKIKSPDTNYLFFTTSNLSSLGINNLCVKTFDTDEEISSKGLKSKYEAVDILLEMSELGKVLVKITRQGDLSYYQIIVEDKNIKEFVEENLQGLLTDLENVGFPFPNINCLANPGLKNQDFYAESTITRTEKGYSRIDTIG